MPTNDTANTGIMHLRVNGRVVCRSNRAIMAAELASFSSDPRQCVKCAAVLVKMQMAAQRKAIRELNALSQ